MNDNELLKKGYKKYSGEGIDVYFCKSMCKHAGRCVNGDHQVFDLSRKPWILPDQGSTDAIIKIIESCPSGALKYRLKDQD